MRRQLLPALVMLLVFTAITGIVYPLVVTGVGQLLFHDKANGSLLERDGKVVGSAQIGQQFADAKYFHPRPSSAGDGYDSAASSGSNLGPTNDKLLQAVAERVNVYRRENNLPADTLVPVDAVTGSGSGLDPAISVANAKLQAPRVARARHVSIRQVQRLIDDHTDGRGLGFLGEPAVNVLELNLALDRL
ncbi:K(+)-transporting ATPase subunit C [Mycobacterium riyadhense]|uniref:Potassium-transporting ATPase KdpC subunit n=1 Tax=Mycobacterium riyadhense TaxID=486698 RepID=A0A1X2AYS9_9MYCO|nr:K(+)-transporting ATPase subunit C [Mycobacterium riyadhense]MCV7149653.1 K(+)-transporting ATPase subunit C [Mycobacterium riyadhense]ORW56535.1 ATPase [Mycobacterium riyadhense]